MTAENIRFGVIGCGRMGVRRMQTIADHPAASLEFVVDVNEDDARNAAEKFGVSYYLDYGEALERHQADAGVVSVPNKWHADTVSALLDGGLHVFCEKPLARNAEEARAMVEAATRNRRTIKTGSNLRYFPSVLKAWELLKEGAIGETMFLRTWIGHEGWNLEGKWFSDAELAGGGTFLDNGCHVLDIARWFMGEFVECTGAVATVHWPIAPLEDNGVGIFFTENGRFATVHASWTEWAGYMYLEVYGSDGFIRIDNRGRASKTVLGRAGGETEEFDYSAEPPTSYQNEFGQYIQDLQQGIQSLPSGYDGLRAVRMAHGVYESARSGRRVSIFTDEDRALKRLCEGEA